MPLATALGIASGASPDKGLVTAIVAGFLISALGGSRVQVGGPTSAFVVVIAGVIAEHRYSGLVLATTFAGIFLVIAGYAGVGKLMRYVPLPMATGFTAGIAVIIASSQIGDFLGLDAGKVPADFIGKWSAYAAALGSISLSALPIGAASLVLIIVLRKTSPRLPGYLIAVVAASLAVTQLHLPVETVGMRFPTCRRRFPRRNCRLFRSPWSRTCCLLPSPLPSSRELKRCCPPSLRTA